MIFVYRKQNNFCKPEQREGNSYNPPMGQSKFSYELTFWFISSDNGGKQKSKNTLRVEINKFGDGKRKFLCHRQNVRGQVTLSTS